MKFEIEQKVIDNVAVIRVKGEVDMLTSPDVRNTLVPFFNRGLDGIVVDLSNVTYMDSSGIATMVEGLQWSGREGKKFILAGTCSRVMDVFELTHLKDAFEFSPDSESALKEIL